jgi:hypothetical protein
MPIDPSEKDDAPILSGRYIKNSSSRHARRSITKKSDSLGVVAIKMKNPSSARDRLMGCTQLT